MAKLNVEVVAHGSGRNAKKSDNTRIVVDTYHKNTFLGSFEVYQVHSNDTVNVLWRPHGKGCGSEIPLVTESMQN